jgi:hypothetical protein
MELIYYVVNNVNSSIKVFKVDVKNSHLIVGIYWLFNSLINAYILLVSAFQYTYTRTSVTYCNSWGCLSIRSNILWNQISAKTCYQCYNGTKKQVVVNIQTSVSCLSLTMIIMNIPVKPPYRYYHMSLISSVCCIKLLCFSLVFI